MPLVNPEQQYNYSDVLIKPVRNNIPSRSFPKIEREFSFLHSPQTKYGTGIIAANMDTVGTIPMARALVKNSLFTSLHKHIPDDQLVSLFKEQDAKNFMFFTMGSSEAELHRLSRIISYGAMPDMVCIDIANGYSDILLDQVRRVRALYPNLVIMAGNVVCGTRTAELLISGADIVKVGIGPGSACTTRKLTGVGRPQFSAVEECAAAANRLGGMICADGGIVEVGDIGKALIAGADFVMLGGMLAAHEESGGTLIDHTKVLGPEVKMRFHNDGVAFEYFGTMYPTTESLPGSAWSLQPLAVPEMVFYGMSSETAMRKYNGGIATYRAAEGRTVKIPYRGPVAETISDLLGGLRSTMTYVGCLDISKMAYCTTFYLTNQQYNTVYAK